MWKKDWADAAAIAAWVGVWSMLVYFVPLGGM
ncbi:Membrane protein [Vibrio mytili]|uniref:Membrane protein n=1 Tax=Vibrio mytili TaxID=50718 RepID=A0A0C3EBV6_9VIBR|nr:membrane protein [Vibrio mytili]